MDCYVGQRLFIYQPHIRGQFWCKVIEIRESSKDLLKAPALVVEEETDGTIRVLPYFLKGLSWDIAT